MRRAHAWVASAVLLAGCLGGQPPRTKEQSRALGNRAEDVPQATRAQNDWKEAARGHGAAGRFSSGELGRLEAASAPGANVQADAGLP